MNYELDHDMFLLDGRKALPFNICPVLGCISSLQAKGLPSHQWWEHPQCSYTLGQGKRDRVKRSVGDWVRKEEIDWRRERIHQLAGRNGMSLFSLIETPALWSAWAWCSLTGSFRNTLTSCSTGGSSGFSGWRVAPTQCTQVRVDKDTKCFSHVPMYPGTKALGSLG